MSATSLPLEPAASSGQWRTVLRHRWPLRLMHWINLACMLAMVGSGLQILNAHPALYWGEAAHFEAPLASASTVTRGGELRGVTQVGSARFDSTGLLGAANNPDGARVRAVAPSWAMIPGSRNLAVGRRWHFFFGWLWVINGTLYLLWSAVTRHLQRDLAMQRRDWREIPKSIMDHLRFRHPVGDEATRYNPLQKLAYLGVIFGLTPLIVLTGLSMSPQMDGLMGGFIDLVGGRQSARTLHFIAMSSFVLFAIVHVLMVVYAGPINEMRSMLSGRFRIRTDPASTLSPASASKASPTHEEACHD